MVEEFRTAFQELIDASVATDPHQFPTAVHRVHTLAGQVPHSERELALQALTSLLTNGTLAPGITADLAVLAGALVEAGTDPGQTPPQILKLLRSAGQGALVFAKAWQRTGTDPLPEPEQITAAAEARVAADLGEHTAPAATMCWWTITRHGLAAHTMLGEPGTRALLRRDPALYAELVALANQLSDHLPEFEDIRALLRMSQATSALVMDRHSGRAFRVLFDGIGDNCQLHTLLAAALIGPQGHDLAGQEPDPVWVRAFRDGPAHPGATVRGWWNLVAHDGTWVWNEGVPAQIPTLHGERLLILDDQPYPRSWKAARRHPHVYGWLVVDSELSQAEARLWWKNIAPAESALPEDGPPLPQTGPDLPDLSGPDHPTTAEQDEGTDEQHRRTGQEESPEPEETAEEEPPQQPADPQQGPSGAQQDARDQERPDPEEEGQGEPEQDLRRAHPGLGLPPLPPEVSRNHAWGPAWRR